MGAGTRIPGCQSVVLRINPKIRNLYAPVFSIADMSHYLGTPQIVDRTPAHARGVFMILI